MKYGRQIVVNVTKLRCQHHKLSLEEFFVDSLNDVKKALAPVKGSSSGALVNLLDLLNSTASSILNEVKSVLADVQLFSVRDINFSNIPYFSQEFAYEDVREVIIADFIRFIHIKMEENIQESRSSTQMNPALLLFLSRLSRDFEQSTIAYILTLTDEQFLISSRDKVTSVLELTSAMSTIAHKLLDNYVKLSGWSVSRMIRTSLESRDWLKSVEPRQVRAVMRRVVEEMTLTDQQVGSLYEEGVRKARSSDSSRRTFPMPQTSRQRDRTGVTWGMPYAPSSTIDNSLLSNIQKLFSERVDVFEPIEFTRTSVMTGILKIGLKTLHECVRLKTFGKFGLQQLQVDCHYLQLYLWRFASDENIITTLLDEVITSCVNRCVEPTPMEPSVISVICERG